MPYIHIDNSSLYYEKCGLGNPLVLIHGSCLSSKMWEDSYDIIAHHRQVVAYDQRGYGKSILMPGENYSQENDLHMLYENLKFNKADLLGLSSGAQIAVDFYLQFPNKVNSLILVSPALSGGPINNETTEIDNKTLKSINEKKCRETVQLNYQHPVFASAINNIRCNSLLREIIKNHDSEIVTANPPKRLRSNSASRLAEIKTPSLILLGENDLTHFHQISRLLNAGIENSILKTIPEAGHMLNMEKPDIFNDILLSFLQGEGNI